MKLSVKLGMTMGGFIVILCLLGAFSLYQMDKLNQSITDIAENWLPSVVHIEALNTLVSDYRTAEVQHIYSTDTEIMNSMSREMDNIAASMATHRQALLAFLSEENKKTFESYMRARGRYLGIHAKITGLSEQLKTDEAIALLTGESSKIYDEMSDRLDGLVQHMIDQSMEVSKQGDEDFASARLLILVLLGIAVVVASGVAVWIIRNTLHQLGKDPGELGQIARRVTGGEYAVDDGSPKEGVYGDIVGMVASLKENIDNARRESERAAEESRKAHEAMEQAEAAGREAEAKAASLLRAADKLEEVAGIVSSASEELSAQIEQSEHGASEQAARAAETATAMEEMNSTVLEVAKNAGAASDVSAQTRAKAEQGAAVVGKAVASIEGVQRRSLALKEDMAVLGEHAQSISRIMSVISDIADQTNLLALNAAIEAARAGEAGRGFAVVADEVRKLAEKTMASTTDVGNAIAAIRQSADKSIHQVDEAVENIEEATELATQSGTALQEIVSMVDSTADQVRAIATASEQQSSTSEEINKSVSQVNSIAGETARAMEEAARAVSDLAGQAQALSGLIEDMKNN